MDQEKGIDTTVEESTAEHEPPFESNGAGDVDSDSILAQLRAKRRALSEDRTIDLEIPGYDGFIVCRYHAVEFERVNQMIKKAQKARNSRVELNIAADLLIEACDEFFVRRDTGELQPLVEADESFGDDPVRFDQRLAIALEATDKDGKPVTRARDVAMALFGNNGLALVAHQNDVVEWLKDVSSEDDQGF